MLCSMLVYDIILTTKKRTEVCSDNAANCDNKKKKTVEGYEYFFKEICV